jgi:hypothetical protein
MGPGGQIHIFIDFILDHSISRLVFSGLSKAGRRLGGNGVIRRHAGSDQDVPPRGRLRMGSLGTC